MLMTGFLATKIVFAPSCRQRNHERRLDDRLPGAPPDPQERIRDIAGSAPAPCGRGGPCRPARLRPGRRGLSPLRRRSTSPTTIDPFIPDLQGAGLGRARHPLARRHAEDEPTLIVDLPSIEAIPAMPRDRIEVVDHRGGHRRAATLLLGDGRIGLDRSMRCRRRWRTSSSWPCPSRVGIRRRRPAAPARRSCAEMKPAAASRLGSRMIEAMTWRPRSSVPPMATWWRPAWPSWSWPRRLKVSFMASGRGGPEPTVTRCNFRPGRDTASRGRQLLQAGISGVLDGDRFDGSPAAAPWARPGPSRWPASKW